MGRFRFEELEIWQRGARLSGELFRLADALEQQRLYRFSEQLRGAVLSITNNIAEGSGSESNTDFANFLNIARRSVFEVANILMLLDQAAGVSVPEREAHLDQLEQLSRMITAFRRTLKR